MSLRKFLLTYVPEKFVFVCTLMHYIFMFQTDDLVKSDLLIHDLYVENSHLLKCLQKTEGQRQNSDCTVQNLEDKCRTLSNLFHIIGTTAIIHWVLLLHLQAYVYCKFYVFGCTVLCLLPLRNALSVLYVRTWFEF